METFNQSRVVVVVVAVAVVVDVAVVVVVIYVVGVIIGEYSPVTGNRARRLRGRTSRHDVGPRNPVVAHNGPLLAVAGTGAGENPPVSADAPHPLGGDALPDEDSPAAPGKCSVGDAASGEVATGVNKSLLVRSSIWSTNPSAYGSADTPLSFSWLAGMLVVKSRTQV